MSYDIFTTHVCCQKIVFTAAKWPFKLSSPLPFVAKSTIFGKSCPYSSISFYVSKSFGYPSFSWPFLPFKFHLLYVAMGPRRPMQLVNNDKLFSVAFLHLSFCWPCCIKKCLFIPHAMFYTYHFLHLKGTAPETKDVADPLGNHLIVV